MRTSRTLPGFAIWVAAAIGLESLGCSTPSPGVLADDASIGVDANNPSDSSRAGPEGGGGDAGSSCGIPECFRPVNCRANCTGPVVLTGCCPCPSPYFDDICCSTNSCP
jgi:hypothetical protein